MPHSETPPGSTGRELFFHCSSTRSIASLFEANFTYNSIYMSRPPRRVVPDFYALRARRTTDPRDTTSEYQVLHQASSMRWMFIVRVWGATDSTRTTELGNTFTLPGTFPRGINTLIYLRPLGWSVFYPGLDQRFKGSLRTVLCIVLVCIIYKFLCII